MKLDDLSHPEKRSLLFLWHTSGQAEIRCPQCWTFHKKDCTFQTFLRSAIRTIDPKLAEELKGER